MRAEDQASAVPRRLPSLCHNRGGGARFCSSVIPGRANGSRECAPDDRLRANPESRDSGSGPSDHPGMTECEPSKHLEIFALFPVRYFGLEALDFGVLDVDVVVDKAGAERVAKEW